MASINSKQSGFTLIELMVVISIIGVLSSVVITTVSSAREKARIAKTLSFSASIQHALGADAVAIYTFNDAAGTTVTDSSGYNNDGTVNGALFKCASGDTVTGKGCAMQFDGVDDYIRITQNNLHLPTAFTVSLWVNPTLIGSIDYAFWRNDDRPSIRMSGSKWAFMVDGNIGNAFSSSSDIILNQWSHLVLTFDGTTSYGYINGVLDGKKVDSRYTEGTTFLIGSDGVVGRFLQGSIDDVRIYTSAMPLAQIQQYYAEGLARHSVAKK